MGAGSNNGMGGGGYAAASGMGGGGYGLSPAVSSPSAGMRVADWLQANGLQTCASVLADLGYDEGIDMLIESDNEEQQDMVNAVRIYLSMLACLLLPPCVVVCCCVHSLPR